MAEQEVHELIIIKHRGGHDDEEHGSHGVWKIAYADFMTAMMAFFLVLWLLNSTNKEAKISIRNYFNPIKLAEASMTRKGIIDEKDATPAAAPDTSKKSKSDDTGDKKGESGLFGSSSQPDEKSATTPSDAKKPEGPKPQEGPKPTDAAKPQEGQKPTEGPKPQEGAKPLDGAKGQPGAKPAEGAKPGASAAAPGPTYTEAQLFKDPYRVLSDISAQAPAEAPPGAKTPGPPGPAGQAGDAAASYQDPFESISPSRAPQSPGAPLAQPAQPAQPAPAPAPAPRAEAAPQPQPAPAVAATPMSAPGKPGAGKGASQGEASGGTSGAPSAAAQSDAAKLKTEMANALKAETATQPGPKIEVQATSEGVLISLTDEFDFGMFAVGSAEPQPKLVKIMEKIAQILKTRAGQVVVRGHTDGRAYKASFTYDNWRLSSDRAQMARYMLVRGGLDEKRFEAVEGYADRRLRLPADPAAAENRRIEILLRPEKT